MYIYFFAIDSPANAVSRFFSVFDPFNSAIVQSPFLFSLTVSMSSRYFYFTPKSELLST